MDTSLPEVVSIKSSTPFFLVIAEPIFAPIALPARAPRTEAISDSVSESVVFLPATPPIAAPAAAPIRPVCATYTRSRDSSSRRKLLPLLKNLKV